MKLKNALSALLVFGFTVSLFAQSGETVIQSFRSSPPPSAFPYKDTVRSDGCRLTEYSKPNSGYATFGNLNYAAVKFVPIGIADTGMEISWNLEGFSDFQYRSIRYTLESKVSWAGKTGLMIDIMPESNTDSLLFRFTVIELADTTKQSLMSRADEKFWWFQSYLTVNGGQWMTISMPFDQFFPGYGDCTPENDGNFNLKSIIGWEINTVKEARTTENPFPKMPVKIVVKNLRIY